MLVERLCSEIADFGRILPKFFLPRLFILERFENLGGDSILLIRGEHANFPECVFKQLRHGLSVSNLSDRRKLATDMWQWIGLRKIDRRDRKSTRLNSSHLGI